ncbi:MAG: hypothetical protein JNL75_05950 [Chitinophagales bacterium]|nr:hypothetical protein [Chitinophagales bacterium]
MIAKKILDSDMVFDIVISDFGRKASIDFLRLLECIEREYITELIKENDMIFFDEYRRIMFELIGDVNFLKREHIDELNLKFGCINSEILIALGDTGISDLFQNKLFLRIVPSINAAINFGYKKIRIAIICNSLSDTILRMAEIFNSNELITLYFNRNGLSLHPIEKILSTEIRACTVPEGVLDSCENRSYNNLLIMGTKETNNIYHTLNNNKYLSKFNIIYLDNEDYTNIEKWIINSISFNQSIDSLIFEIKEKLIKKYEPSFQNLVLVEACTDFNLKIGVSSMEMFADFMVKDCYSKILI